MVTKKELIRLRNEYKKKLEEYKKEQMKKVEWLEIGDMVWYKGNLGCVYYKGFDEKRMEVYVEIGRGEYPKRMTIGVEWSISSWGGIYTYVYDIENLKKVDGYSFWRTFDYLEEKYKETDSVREREQLVRKYRKILHKCPHFWDGNTCKYCGSWWNEDEGRIEWSSID